MLSLLAARAQSWVMEQSQAGEVAEAILYCGVHADDGVNWAYPDCTPEFIGAMANAIFIGTYHKVRLRAPLQYLDKAGVVREGLRLHVPYSLTWSCYKGEDLHCGICPTCRSRKEAFELNGQADPVEYAS
jgi:7-cyano-7-deazaguanine synthase